MKRNVSKMKRQAYMTAGLKRGLPMYRLRSCLVIRPMAPWYYYWSYFMLLLALFSMPYILGTLFVLTSLLVDAAFMPRRSAGIRTRFLAPYQQHSTALQLFQSLISSVLFCVCIFGRDSTRPFLCINVLCLEARRQIYTVSYVQFNVFYSEWFAFWCNAILESLLQMLMFRKKKYGTVYTG